MMPLATQCDSIAPLRALLGELESLGAHITGDAVVEALARRQRGARSRGLGLRIQDIARNGARNQIRTGLRQPGRSHRHSRIA